MEREQHPHRGPGNWERAAWPEAMAALDWLPLPSLMLAPDGSALEANEAWAGLSAAPAEAARGEGWLRVVSPPDRRPLRARLREAAAAGEAGRADFTLAGPAGERKSRWWWRPGPAGRLIACVAELDEHWLREENSRREDLAPMAGLVRHDKFLTLTARALRRSRCDGTYVAVVAVSLDGTAGMGNDAGLSGGDEVSRAVAERVLGAVGARGAATLVDRAEFAVLCGDMRDPGDAGIAASRIREAVARPLEAGGAGVPIAAVTGFALAASPSETAGALIARACLAIRSARPDQPAGLPAPARAAAAAVRPADGLGAGSQAPAVLPAGRAASMNAGADPAGADPAGADPAGADLAGMVVPRLFGIGLTLQSAAGLANDPVARRLQEAVDELDAVIRQVRRAALKFRHPGQPDGWAAR